ncbi:hypothetical protein ACLB2K_044010 [Fragaria x ananassa]
MFLMGCCRSFLLLLFALSSLFLGTHQLPSSQTQVLLQLRKHLEYPSQLEIWKDHTVDFCSISSSAQVNITCLDNLVVELRIKGDKPAKVTGFHGFSIPGQTLSEAFLLDSFVTNLVRLSSLKVLSLVSLGIWGQLPDKIHRLTFLEYLDLSSNFLFGSVPPRISAMVKLQTLVMDGNFLNGTVPSWFGSLSNLSTLSFRNNQLRGPLLDLSSLGSLQVLDLSVNKLNDVLPSMPKRLVMLSLSNNAFSGEIPQQYRKLSALQHLDMSFNTLTGTPLAALFSLPYISYLNLASNSLSGSLPSHLSCGIKLDYIDISNNSLTGDLPSCLGTESAQRVVKFGGNCLSVSMQNQHPQSYCNVVVSPKEKQSGGKEVGILVGMIAGILVLLVLLVLSCILLCRRYLPRGVSEQHLLHKSEQDHPVAVGFSTEMLTNARFISQAAKAGMLGLPGCRTFSLEELVDITRNFDNSALLGEGSYGKLYKGRLQNGIQVVIRCLLVSKKYTIRNLKLRLDLLAKLRHPHLVCLLGHCLDGGGDDYSVNKVYLVSEYVSNGTFRAKLSGRPEKVLNWPRRLGVLIGVAKAVHFLHTGIIPGFLSNRLKMNNILLNEHDNAKLSDYGLSIISEETDTSMANEGHKSWQMKSLEDDAYSFGYILLEAIVGASVSARREAFLLNDLASLNTQEGRKQLVEPIVLATCSQQSLSIVISIMSKCISPEASRPSFEDILWNLQYAVQVQATADGDNRYDTASHL